MVSTVGENMTGTILMLISIISGPLISRRMAKICKSKLSDKEYMQMTICIAGTWICGALIVFGLLWDRLQ